MQRQLKKTLSIGLGVPAAFIVFSEANSNEGFILQLIAVAVLIGIFAINGLFREQGVHG